MHYAARYNAIEAMTTLIELGASFLEKDYRSQMPLFVAADAGLVAILITNEPESNLT